MWGSRVLIIDPNEEHQMLAVTALSRAGHQVDSAMTAHDGLRLAQENRYDAIVVDDRLRDLAAFDVLRSLGGLDSNIPRIYVASARSEKVAIRALERGATGIVLKTASYFEHLPLEIEEQIRNSRLRAESERQRAALRVSEERYRTLFERAHDPVFMIDSRGQLLAFNRALCDLTGYERDELLRKNLFDLLVADPGPHEGIGRDMLVRWQRIYEASPGHPEEVAGLFPRTTEDPEALQFGVRRKDGSVTYVEVTTRLIQQGSLVVGIEAIARDVTARRATERTLRRMYATLAAVYDASPEGILVVDDSGTPVDANSRTCEILGVTRDALLRGGTSLLRSFAERFADPAGWTSVVDRAAQNPEAVIADDLKVTHPVANTLRVYSSPIRDPAGTIAGRVWVLGDGTSGRATDRRINETELMRLRELFKSSSDGFVFTDGDGTILDANGALCELLGFSREEVIGRLARDFVDPKVREAFDGNMAAIRHGASFEGDLLRLRLRTKSGEIRRVSIRYVAHRGDGVLVGLSAIVRTAAKPQST